MTMRLSFARKGCCRYAGMVTIALLLMLTGRPAWGQLRVVTYNIAQLNGNLSSLEDVIAALQDDDKVGFVTPVSVFIFQEVQSDDVAQLLSAILSTAPPGTSYSGATYTSGPGEDGSGGAQAMFYNANLLLEDLSAHIDLATGGNRATDRWKLCLNDYDSPDACFYVYGSHLKAGSSQSDIDDREDGVDVIRANSATLPSGSHIIYAGDMNFSSASEPGYLAFITGGPGGAVDPIGGQWTGSPNAIKHTQSPRLTNAGGLIGGGLDDRFDFQLPTADFNDGEGLAYITGSYRAFGNDGAHYNDSINAGNNSYYPGDIPRSNILADDLHNASDHIPVIAEYQIPALMLTLLPPSYGTVIQDAVFDVAFFVSNDAPVTDPIGADALDIVAAGTGGLSGVVSESIEPLSGLFQGAFALDTSQPGIVDGTVIVTTSNEGVSPSIVSLDTTGTVLRHANPSFDGVDDVDTLAIQFNVDADTGLHPFQASIFNHSYDALQALLDVDAVVDVVSPYAFTGGLAGDIGAGSTTLEFTFDSTGLAPGSYPMIVTVETSDEDLPGEVSHILTLDIDVVVDGVATCIGDCAAGGDGVVDVVDVLALLAQWGTNGVCDIAPVDGDDVVDVQDLLTILSAWGPCR